MNVLQFLATVIGQGVLLAAAAWLIRALISNSLAREAEAFKAELQVAAHRRNTTFSRLHEQRAEVMRSCISFSRRQRIASD
jgi:hypothetical protein